MEILDSFNPRIHGVLEHLHSCLATRQVRKNLIIEKYWSANERRHDFAIEFESPSIYQLCYLHRVLKKVMNRL